LLNKELDPDFFEESSVEEDDEAAVGSADKVHGAMGESDDSSSEELAMSFKFNIDHCLHVFNVLKQGGVHNNYFESSKRGVNQGN